MGRRHSGSQVPRTLSFVKTSKICTCDTHVFVKTISNAMEILIDLSAYSKVRWLVLD